MTGWLDLGRKRTRVVFSLVGLSFLSVGLPSQTPTPGIMAAINDAQRTTLPRTHPPTARQANDADRATPAPQPAHVANGKTNSPSSKQPTLRRPRRLALRRRNWSRAEMSSLAGRSTFPVTSTIAAIQRVCSLRLPRAMDSRYFSTITFPAVMCDSI